jgi:precorrin-6A/cobalt-precorrin-6A reductase
MDSRQVATVQFDDPPVPDQTHRVLILGGTTEAFQFATDLSLRPDLTIITSLAGRVSQPSIPAGLVRIGGFGGVTGLIEYLTAQKIAVVVDATHPFAAKITQHAESACEQTKTPLISFERSAWLPQQGDHWLEVPDVASAAVLLNDSKYRVLLSVGRQELAAFMNCNSACFLVRAIDEPTAPLPPNSKLILSRGPFHLDEERQLLRQEAITHIVSKNSGGAATYAKIQAARELGITIVMIDRRDRDRSNVLTHVDEVYSRLDEILTALQCKHMETQPL